jgi:hypothetical protein
MKSPFAQPEKTAEPIANPARATKCIFIVSSQTFRLVVGQTTCFGISQAPGTSVSRGVRRNALVKASERHRKKRPVLFGVNANYCVLAGPATLLAKESFFKGLP